MSSVRVRHPALEGSSSVRILVVTNAYPAPERPAYGIYVARLVAALERDGHEVAARGLERAGRRLAHAAQVRAPRPGAPASAARRQPAGRRLGPLPRADRDDRPPRGARRARPVRAHRARHRRRQRRALAAHPQGDAARRSATPARSSPSRTTWPRAWRRSPGPLGDRLHIVSAGVDLEAFTDGDAEVARSRARMGRATGRASPTSATSSRARTSPRLLGGLRGGARGVGRRLARARRRRAAQAELEALAARSGHRRQRALRRGRARRPTCRAGCAPATSPAWSPSARASAWRRSRRWPAAGPSSSRASVPAGVGGDRGRHGRALRRRATSPAWPRRSCAQRRSTPGEAARAAAEPYSVAARDGARGRRAGALPALGLRARSSTRASALGRSSSPRMRSPVRISERTRARASSSHPLA